MGKRGPAPAPSNVKRLKGTQPPGANTNEPEPSVAEFTAPEDLTPEAREVWDRLAPDLVRKQVVTHCNQDGFTVYCECVAAFSKARDLLGAGLLVKGRSHGGGLVTNPAWRIFRDAAQLVRTYAQEFGLTPAAQASLSIADDYDSDDAALLRLLTPARHGPPKGRDRPP